MNYYYIVLPFLRSSPSNFLLFSFPLPFFSLEIEFIAEIARLRPTIGVPMPTLSETLRTGPYPPPPQDKFCNVLPNTDPEYVERVSIFLILH